LLWIGSVALDKLEIIVVSSDKALDAFFRHVAAEEAGPSRQEDVQLIEGVVREFIKTEQHAF
jgi:hypothetical protein